jgi:hypothetical protein
MGMPGEYAIYFRLSALAGSVMLALIYAGAMLLIFWYLLPSNREKKR